MSNHRQPQSIPTVSASSNPAKPPLVANQTSSAAAESYGVQRWREEDQSHEPWTVFSSGHRASDSETLESDLELGDKVSNLPPALFDLSTRV